MLVDGCDASKSSGELLEKPQLDDVVAAAAGAAAAAAAGATVAID